MGTSSRKRQNSDDQQDNPVSVESEALPEIELHHQEDNNNCDVGNSDSDSSSSASAKKRARIDEQSAALSSINPLKLIRRLVPGTNQETYTIQEKEKQHILQRLEEENCQTPKKQETQQDNTPPFVVYNYMDNLPTFSDLTQNKLEQTVKKKEDIKLSSSLLNKSTSAVKEIQVKEVSTNLETKSKQEPKSPIPETKQEAKSMSPETNHDAK